MLVRILADDGLHAQSSRGATWSLRNTTDAGTLPCACYGVHLLPRKAPTHRTAAVLAGDLRSDIYLARTAPANAALDDTLLLQEANGFTDSSFLLANIAATACESVAAADFANDMDLDLYLVCLGPASNSPNILLENTGNGEFLQVPQAGGAAGSNQGRGESSYHGVRITDAHKQAWPA